MKPSLKSEFANGARFFKVAGEWTSDFAEDCLVLSSGVQPVAGQPVKLVCDGMERIDITGAWIVQRRIRELRQQGTEVNFEGFKPEHAQFIDQVRQWGADVAGQKPVPHSKFFDVVGFAQQRLKKIGDMLMFLGRALVLLGQTFLHPSRFRFRAFVKQCDVAAIGAAPIVGLITFLIAIVLTYQGASQLSRFGAEIYTVNLVIISILREMGVLLTAIMIAGRSGSAFAAEIGAMKLNEEIDALKTTGLEPMEILVLPRVLALTIMMPLLTFLADMTGIVGTGFFTVLTTKTSALLFVSRMTDALRMNDFWIGLAKAPVFGLTIALIGCYHGMAVLNSAESVGRETTRAVVHSIFAVMLLDALFSIILTTVGL